MLTPQPTSLKERTNEFWLSIVGIGEDGWEGLSAAAKQAVESSEILYGGTRHLAHIPVGKARRIAWPSPMASAVNEILTMHRGKTRVSVLASGDPMLFGVGVTLTRHLESGEFRVMPQVSSFSLACARLGWSVSETILISLVSRPIEQLYRYLHSGQRFVVYSEDGTTPAAVARLLADSGYGSSQLAVFEYMGGPAEKRLDGSANRWSVERCGELNLIAIDCVGDIGSGSFSLVPGLPEDCFETDGQLTKREVRAVTLARLGPRPGERLWDVGAGSGTIGIEWMRSHPSCSCVAFEVRDDRAARIVVNAKRLGVTGLEVICGIAPKTFDGLKAPNAIFIGGGLGREGLFKACWDKLMTGGRLVTNAVTIESEAAVANLQKEYGGELVRILVARAEPVGETLGWRHLMPITQWIVAKL